MAQTSLLLNTHLLTFGTQIKESRARRILQNLPCVSPLFFVSEVVRTMPFVDLTP